MRGKKFVDRPYQRIESNSTWISLSFAHSMALSLSLAVFDSVRASLMQLLCRFRHNLQHSTTIITTIVRNRSELFAGVQKYGA